MYEITIFENDFNIEYKHESEILKSIKKSDLPSELKKGENLKEVFENFGFCLDILEENYESISQEYNRNSTDESFQRLLFIIAPWVKQGSFIQCMGENPNDIWEWEFEDERLFWKEGFISFRRMEIVVDKS